MKTGILESAGHLVVKNVSDYRALFESLTSGNGRPYNTLYFRKTEILCEYF